MGRTRKVALILLPPATVAALAFVGWRTSDLGRASGDLAHQIALAKKEGVPTEWADLHRLSPKLDPAENAAVVYERAFLTLRATGADRSIKDNAMRTLALGTMADADLAALKRDLLKAGPALAQAREGARKPAFSFDREWEKGAALTFPEYSYARATVRALVLRAMLAKTPGAAVDDLRTAATMRRHFGSEPVLIGALVANSMETDVHRGIRAIGRRGGEWNAAVRPILDDLGPIPALRQTLTGEAVWNMHFTEELRREGADAFVAMGYGETSTPIALRMARFAPVRDAYQSRVVEYWRNAWRELPQDPTDFRAANAALPDPSTKSGPSYAMLEFLMPVFSQFALTNTQAETNRRMTRAALDLWAGRTPTLERDPFGTTPLRLRRSGSEWMLTSVGSDGIDDAGKAPRPSEGRYDITLDSKGVSTGRTARD